MKLYKTSKIVFSVENNVDKFLNGITSNTLDAPNNAFLDIHGKIVATFDQAKISDDEFLILIEQPFVENVIQHTQKYVMLSKVVFAQRDEKVYFDLNGDYQLQEGEYSIPQKKGQLIITNNVLEADVTDEAFTLFRVQNNIPMHGIDYKDEMLLNVSTQDFVSFTKGCFLGQEPISKVYNRSKPSWRLEPKAENELDGREKGEMTSKVVDPATNTGRGFVFVRNDN